MRAATAILAAMLALSGCSAVPTRSSHAPTVTPDDSMMAADIVNLVAGSLPPDATAVWISQERPRFRKAPRTGLDEAVARALRELGFAVAEQDGEVPGWARLSFRVTPLDADLLLVVDLAGKRAARLYGHNAHGELVRLSAFSVRGARR